MAKPAPKTAPTKEVAQAPIEAVASKSAPKSYTKEEMKTLLTLLRVEGGSTKGQIAKALGRPTTAIAPMRKRIFKALGSDKVKVPQFKIVRTGGGARGISDTDLASYLENQDDDI